MLIQKITVEGVDVKIASSGECDHYLCLDDIALGDEKEINIWISDTREQAILVLSEKEENKQFKTCRTKEGKLRVAFPDWDIKTPDEWIAKSGTKRMFTLGGEHRGVYVPITIAHTFCLRLKKNNFSKMLIRNYYELLSDEYMAKLTQTLEDFNAEYYGLRQDVEVMEKEVKNLNVDEEHAELYLLAEERDREYLQQLAYGTTEKDWDSRNQNKIENGKFLADNASILQRSIYYGLAGKNIAWIEKGEWFDVREPKLKEERDKLVATLKKDFGFYGELLVL